MCGIAGLVAPLEGRFKAPDIARLAHRGPDGQGRHRIALPWARVTLSMARLAIVDPRPIAVPFRFAACPGATLAYNGEVYNWRELRGALSDGTPWETDCDAEVVARALFRYGSSALRLFNGMFALVFVDERRGTVLLARDRAGEKPLYYHCGKNGALRFASEPKGLGVALREGPCEELDAFEADCLVTTPLRGVKRLGPGELMVLERPRDLWDPPRQPWWLLPMPAPDATLSFDDAVQRTTEVLSDACRIRVPDPGVPWTLQLSGGLDSALAQSFVNAPTVYTVTFPDDGVDNVRDADLAARGARIIPVSFGLADLEASLEEVAYHLDTPATWTAVCQWFMAQAMRRHGVKVVLTGEGADELFGGYARYRLMDWLDRAEDDPLLRSYEPLRGHVVGRHHDVLARTLNRGGARTLEAVRRVVGDHVTGRSLATDLARVEWHTTMQVLLRMADRMNSAFAIENRAPFLDHRVIELAAVIPAQHKIDARWTKAVLREVARRQGVPTEITDAVDKRGLFLPWNRWCPPVRGSSQARGAWDRAGFATRMREAWRTSLRR